GDVRQGGRRRSSLDVPRRSRRKARQGVAKREGRRPRGQGARRAPRVEGVTAEPPVPLVWLGPHPADLAQSSALASWARAHGFTLVVPGEERPPPMAIQAGAAETSEDIERRLARAPHAVG